MSYNPSNPMFTGSNKPFATQGQPDTAKQWFYDSTTGEKRPFISKEEVISYFDTPIKRRGVTGAIVANVDGTGTEYWWPDPAKVTDADIVKKVDYTLAPVQSVNGRQGNVIGLAEQSSLDTEIQDRTDADTALQNNIDIVSADLNSEISRSVNADNTLSGLLSAERDRAISVEATKADKDSITNALRIPYSDLDTDKRYFTNIDYANKEVYLRDITSGADLGFFTFDSDGILDLGSAPDPEFVGLLIGTIGDLENYVANDVIYSNQTIGPPDISTPTSSTGTSGNIYLNRSYYSMNDGKVSQLKIVTNNNSAPFRLVHLRRFGDVYENIKSYVLTTVSSDPNAVQTIDLTALNIHAYATDAFGIQLTNGVNGKVRVKTDANFNGFTVAPNLKGNFEIPADTIINMGDPKSGNVFLFQIVVDGQAIRDTNNRIDDTNKALGETTPYEILGRIGTNSSFTTSLTAAFIINNNNCLFTSPSQVEEITFVTNFVAPLTEAVIFLVLLTQTSKNTWEELDNSRFPFTVAQGITTLDVTALNIKGDKNSTLALHTATSGVRFYYQNAIDGFNFYSASLVEGKFKLVSNVFPSTPDTGANRVVMNFNARLRTLSATERIEYLEANRIGSDLEGRVEVLEQEVAALPPNNPNNGHVLYNDPLAITGSWINTTWTLNSAQVTVTATATGLANYLMLDKQYSLDRRKAPLRVRLGSDTRFAFFTKPKDPNATQSTMIECDASSGQLKIYNAFSGGTTMPTVLSTTPCIFLADRDYILELSIDKDLFKNTIRVTDGLTGEFTELIDTTGASGRQHDQYAFACISGTFPTVKSFAVTTPITGDISMGNSINEAMGNGVLSVDGFAQQIVKALDNNGGVSGRGSGNIDGVIRRLTSEVLIIKPKKLVVMIGTNAGNTLAKLQQVAQFCQDNGIKLFLNHIPMRGDQDVSARNADIDTVRSQFGLTGANMDIATALNYDTTQGFDPAKFYSDQVHPLNFGGGNTPFMFNRQLLDTPELFY